VEAGGALVIGPMSDIRNLDAGKFTHAPFGSLEDWAGVYCKHSVPGFPEDYPLRWADGHESVGSLWYDALEPRGSEPLATYMDGPNAGCAALVRRKVGSGEIILLGTLPRPDDLIELLMAAGVRPVAAASESVLVVPRSGLGGEGMIVLEIGNKPGYIELAQPMTDLLTGASLAGRVELAPYATLVLRHGSEA
jgi:beta-galactosidase GanA